MDRVARYVDSRAQALAGHPLTGWLAAAAEPPARRLAIVSVLAPFARALRDSCLWQIPYPSPRGRLQEAVNARAAANAAHCATLLTDWDALGLDRELGWGAADTLWWMFLAPETAPARQAAMQIPVLAAADRGDPVLRYAWVSALAGCLDVLFRAAAPVAQAAARDTGVSYPYLGGGHTGGSRDPVTGPVLDEAGLAAATALAGAAVNAAGILFDGLYEYATAYTCAGRLPARPPGTPLPPAPPAWPLQPRSPRQGRIANAQVEQLLYENRGQTARHPLYAWLGASEGPRAAGRLAVLLPEWAPVVLGLHDVCAYVLPLPQDRAAADLNARARELAGHAAVFLAGWDALGVDELLGWSASQTLRWLATDARLVTHRQGLAQLTQFAASCATPLTRMWFLEMLESACPARVPVTMDAARSAEQDLGAGCHLDYLAGRCAASAPAGVRFRMEPLSLPETNQVTGMIRELFAGLQLRLDQGLDQARARAVRLPRPVARPVRIPVPRS